jgi:hypothetical protein
MSKRKHCTLSINEKLNILKELVNVLPNLLKHMGLEKLQCVILRRNANIYYHMLLQQKVVLLPKDPLLKQVVIPKLKRQFTRGSYKNDLDIVL